MLRCSNASLLHGPMTATTIRPRTRRWTYADYCRIPPDRNRHEIIDGRHYVTPSPERHHQEVLVNLVVWFSEHLKKPGLGHVLCAPMDVHLGRGSVVQPDIIVVGKANRSILGDKKLTGTPDLLVEILSPSTRRYDRKIKLERYERAGVREFWIVDPDAELVEQFVLRKGRYGEPVVSGDSIRLRIVRGVSIDLAEIW